MLNIMSRARKFFFLALTTLAGLTSLAFVTQEDRPQSCPTGQSFDPRYPLKLRTTTPQMREEAAERATVAKHPSLGATPGPGGQPHYFGPEPNYANSQLPIAVSHHGKVQIKKGIRKFVDSLSGLGTAHANNLDQFIPVAVPDTTTYPGSDYYEIALVEYTQQMHSDLGPTTLRGYVQLNTIPRTTDPVKAAHYLGPVIIARKDKPVRIKFYNMLPTGAGGNLFLPVDTSVMGAGTGPLNDTELYTQNRGVLHLHGGNTQWISDGTPHQWITPNGETTSYVQGVSVQPVPDMPIPVPGDGTTTYYYTNQQSARLMFYHDHSYGITRLNVYAGEVAPFLLTDSTEESLIKKGILPDIGIPLVIQDKTFIPQNSQFVKEDPTWNWLRTPGSLWFPHVYMPNQNPADPSGTNPFGRWDYGPWFWPPVTSAAGLVHGPILDPYGSGMLVPGTPNPSIVPKAFLDTPVVNGTAYPYLKVDRKPYRFRILNGCNDRSLNLQLYYADPLSTSIIDGGEGYSKPPKVVFKGGGKKGKKFTPATATATVVDGRVTAITILDSGSGYVSAPKIVFSGGGKHKRTASAIASIDTEVRMIPASPTESVPPYYPMMDGRAGGVPDPTMSGPHMIQIGTEGGFLPNPVVLPNTPIGYQYNRRDITVLNVLEKNLFMGPAERADVIIDFSKVPKHVSRIILYNDAPSPVPAFDPRYDYYTNNPDQTSTGGTPPTIAGYGPNTRTIMQFRLTNKKKKKFNLKALQEALPVAYQASQPPPIVPETTYPGAYQGSTDTYSHIQDTSLTFTPLGTTTPITIGMQPKAIQELFELNYGRMNATLGTELPLTSFANQTTVPLGYTDPPTEFLNNNAIQIWKITHNGVDTHAIHFHLFNVQLINRVGWDGAIRPPDPNELGWKETVRMNPLEDIIVALRPKAPLIPFSIPDSIRYLNPTMAPNMTWSSIDPITGNNTTVTNILTNFGWEYVWHCHLLGHEENDMMRPIVFNLATPSNPSNILATPGPAAGQATITFSAPIFQGSAGPITSYTVYWDSSSFPHPGTATSIVVSGLTTGSTLTFTVTATNAAGESLPSEASNAVVIP
jgi:FtsP/CotA-like multicopper oxidase with cupredoxin domain